MSSERAELLAAIETMNVNPYRVLWLYVRAALSANGANQSATARKLGMHRRTLQRILAQRRDAA